MKIARNLTDLIGSTPLLRLSNFEKSENLDAEIIGKLEYYNPWEASRTELAML